MRISERFETNPEIGYYMFWGVLCVTFLASVTVVWFVEDSRDTRMRGSIEAAKTRCIANAKATQHGYMWVTETNTCYWIVDGKFVEQKYD